MFVNIVNISASSRKNGKGKTQFSHGKVSLEVEPLVAKDDEAAKRTLMVSLCRNERRIIILGSLYAVLIKIARMARYFSTSSLYSVL